ncbi:MAG: thiamine pyrophosphate-binding protein [Candidatus Lernaella stagnicola]|nr:thiamine pyrophosphate-binding protein [Candidatus Lernaella stagnicola]
MAMVPSAKLAAEALIDRGVDIIFTLSGGHITPIYSHLEHSDITLFDTRHEQAAVFMAEAYGRMTRKPGVAMVTAGPGFTNTLSAIANANMANSPLVLISGCAGVCKCEKLDLQDAPQAPIIAPMVKRAFVCHTPSRIPEYIDMAFRTAISGRPGPVYLELPVDVLATQSDESAVKRMKTTIDSHPVDRAGAAKLIEMIRAAKRPMAVAGSGAWYAGVEGELVAFAERTGVPIFTSGMGRGLIPDGHPLCFESAVGTRPGAVLMAQSDADLIILLGNRISLYYIFGDLFDSRAKLAQVDIAPEEIGRNHSIDLPIVSDIRGLLTECVELADAQGLAESLPPQFAEWTAALQVNADQSKNQVKFMWENEGVPIHAMRLAKEIDNFLDRDDDIVVADGGDTQIWMGMTRTVRGPGRYLDSGLFGCLGVGLPYANAAQVLNPDSRVCLMIGDGSTGFNFMEFETAVRKKLPVVTVISNDLGWGMIRHSQQLRLGHAIEAGTYIGEVPYHKLVEALGGKGLRVDKPEDIRPALEEAFASGVPTCINVMTDPDTISPGSIALANVY